MKQILLSISLWLLFTTPGYAQFGDSLKRKITDTARHSLENAVEKTAYRALDRVFSLGKKKRQKEQDNATQNSAEVTQQDFQNASFAEQENTFQTTLPAVITFDKEVKQKASTEDGASSNVYYFTLNGDYAYATHTENDGERSVIMYTKEGYMCMIDDKKKTITVMNMPRVVAEGAGMGKQIAEKINKKPVTKDDEEKMTVTKTGKSKKICGYTAYEYAVKTEGGTTSWWYAAVDFNPIKIYTMGAGSEGTKITAEKAAELKNNPIAIPLLNKNYLMAEIDADGKKGLETLSINKTSFSFSTSGYIIKDMSKKGLKDIIKEKH